jgi:hypothetical protein
MKDIVYLIKTNIPTEEKYKIGITTEGGLQRRVKNLQTGASSELMVITTYKTKYASLIEKTLHRQYNHKKIIGEWFQLSDEEVFTFTKTCTNIENNIILLKEQNNDYILRILKI